MRKTALVSAKNCFRVLSNTFYVQKRCQIKFKPLFLEKYFVDPSHRKKQAKKRKNCKNGHFLAKFLAFFVIYPLDKGPNLVENLVLWVGSTIMMILVSTHM
mgnify:CR=1 FL=1